MVSDCLVVGAQGLTHSNFDGFSLTSCCGLSLRYSTNSFRMETLEIASQKKIDLPPSLVSVRWLLTLRTLYAGRFPVFSLLTPPFASLALAASYPVRPFLLALSTPSLFPLTTLISPILSPAAPLSQVGAVALAKLVSAAGPSLAAVPALPTHLLRRYLDLSAQLQHHRLCRPSTGSATAPNGDLGGRTSAHPWQNGGVTEHSVLGLEEQRQQQQQQKEGLSVGARRDGSGPAGGGSDAAAAPRPPPLHAGSLRLFLGCLCRMLGEAPMLPSATGVLDHRLQQQQQAGLPGPGFASATGEVEEVLRALVEGELRCLGGVLDRRREIGEAGDEKGTEGSVFFTKHIREEGSCRLCPLREIGLCSTRYSPLVRHNRRSLVKRPAALRWGAYAKIPQVSHPIPSPLAIYSIVPPSYVCRYCY